MPKARTTKIAELGLRALGRLQSSVFVRVGSGQVAEAVDAGYFGVLSTAKILSHVLEVRKLREGRSARLWAACFRGHQAWESWPTCLQSELRWGPERAEHSLYAVWAVPLK